MQIHISAGSVLQATLLDNATTRDFTGHLPLTLTLTDYAGTEKISQLPERPPKQLMPHRASNHNPATSRTTPRGARRHLLQ